MKKIAILASGNGTNAERIAKMFNEGTSIRVVRVITNRRKAGVIARMEPLGVPVTYVPNSVWDNNPSEVVELLRADKVDLVVLAGFMHYVAPEIVAAFPHKIVNIHPSLLPAYGGKGMYGHYVHEAVVAAGEKESGVTVHYVTDEMDKGEIVMQQSLALEPGETAESLEAKIHVIEYDLYPRAIVKALEAQDSPTTPPSGNNDDSDKSDKPGQPKGVAESWAEALGVPLPNSPQTPPQPQQSAAETVPPIVPPGGVSQTMQAPQQTPDNERPPMPSSYLIWSILATLACCMIPGIVAIVYSSQVSSKYMAGDYAGAERASKNAQIWIIASIVTGVIFTTLYLPVSMLM